MANPVPLSHKNHGHFEFVKREIRKPSGKYVLVAAHRGDWRNAPENSVQALENAIVLGIDIVEFDLHKTKDGQYIVLHDDTLSRSTTGSGRPENYTLEELRKLRLKDGLGQPTGHLIPTFEEMMMAAKGKIVVDIDKGYTYFDDVVKLVEKLGMQDQSIINITGNVSYNDFIHSYPNVPNSIILMPVMNINKPGGEQVVNSYADKKAFINQLVFSNDTSKLLKNTAVLKSKGEIYWYNSLWPQLSASHNDDVALEGHKPDVSWGWLIRQGATVIQTDRPAALLKYLNRRKLRPNL
jgi:glycerophosphoryl diester phosphodiesterase